jgi:hypothetical protein
MNVDPLRQQCWGNTYKFSRLDFDNCMTECIGLGRTQQLLYHISAALFHRLKVNQRPSATAIPFVSLRAAKAHCH